jgi:hypothetical protein
MGEYVIRFLVGGVIVSVFAVLGDIFRPKSFGGLFAAAPSVALSTLALTVVKDGASYASTEARSMLAGALALIVYSQISAWALMRQKSSSVVVATAALPAWFAVAYGLWFALLK